MYKYKKDIMPLKVPCYRRTSESKCDRAPKSCVWDEDDEKCRSRSRSCSRSRSRKCDALSSKIKKLFAKHGLRVTPSARAYLKSQVCDLYKCSGEFCKVEAKLVDFIKAWKAKYPTASKVSTDLSKALWSEVSAAAATASPAASAPLAVAVGVPVGPAAPAAAAVPIAGGRYHRIYL